MNPRVDLAQKRGELRGSIRDAAIAEFAENGLRGASTQAIADRAGITKTKLHYYIDSKDDLYQQALDHIVGIWEELVDGIPLDLGPEAFLSFYITRKISFSIHHPAEVRMFANEIMRGAPMLRSHWAGSRASTLRAAARIEDWVSAGLIRQVDPMLLQFNIWALTEHYALMAPEVRYMLGLAENAPLDEAKIAAEVTMLVLRGLKP